MNPASGFTGFFMLGFTLMELVIVIGIISILAVIVIPTQRGIDPLRLQQAAQEVRSALLYARSEALLKRGYYGVRFYPDQEILRVFRLDTEADPDAEVFDVRHPLDAHLYTAELGAPGTDSAVDLVAADFDAGGSAESSVAFSASGMPVLVSSLSPIQNGDVTLSLGGVTVQVQVQDVTGLVRIIE